MPDANRILIIGGGGFIGRHLTEQLQAQGHAVTVAGRSARAEMPAGVQYRQGNVSDAARMRELIAGQQYVYDLSLGGGETWADYQREVVDAAGAIGEACLESGVQRLFYASSIVALYLGQPGRRLRESDGSDEGRRFERSLYSRGKLEAERRLLDLHAQRGLAVVIFRPGVVAGPGGMLVHGALGESPADTAIRGWGRGNHPLPWVLAQDVAGAMAAALTAPGVEGLAFNLAGDVRPTAAEFVTELRNRTYRNFRFYPRSLAWMKLDSALRTTIKKLLGKPYAGGTSSRDLESLTMASQLDCSLAKEKLGWRPVADPGEFYRQAIDVHLRPLPAGDLRLEQETLAQTSR